MQAELTAELAMGFIEHDVRYAEISNLNAGSPNDGNLFGGAPDFTYTARAHALRCSANWPWASGSHPDDRQPAGRRWIPGATGAGSTAVRDRIQLIVVNRDTDHAVTPHILVDGLHGSLRVRLSSVSAASFQSYNSPDQPGAVTTQTTRTTASGGTVTLPMPAHSVNLVDISAVRP